MGLSVWTRRVTQKPEYESSQVTLEVHELGLRFRGVTLHPYPFPPPHTDVYPLLKQERKKERKSLIAHFSCTGSLPLALPVSIGSVNLLRLSGVQPGPLPQHDRDASQAGLPAQQILQREVPGAQSGHCENDQGGLQSGVRCP